LAPGGLFDGDGNDGVLDLWRHTVLQDGLAPRDLLQGKFAAFVVSCRGCRPSSYRLG
jgi:hypothetical protein